MHVLAASIFLASCLFVSYSVLGYPLILLSLARLRARPIQKRVGKRNVTVILPVFNGEKWIARKLESISALRYPSELIQIIVVSDGSTDRTEEIAAHFADVEVVRIPKGGKPAAINAGLTRARGEILFFTDVRQLLDPDCLTELVSCFADPEVGAVCGELIICEGESQEERSIGLYWKVEKLIRKQLSSLGSLLVVTGCLYAVRRSLAKPIPPGALGDDIFMPQAVLSQDCRVVFEPRAKAFDFSTDRRVEFQRKVRTLAGLYQFVARFGFGPLPFHFFSYKVSRLVLPYALIGIAITSFLLPSPWLEITIATQLLFYGLAGLDLVLPEDSSLKRVSSPAATFCMLVGASLFAISVFFVPSSTLWKTTHVRSPKLSG